MASKPEKNKNWQLRQYDNFGPHFRIDTGNPQVGEDGATVWGFYGEDPDTKARCSLRQSSTGAFHIFNDGYIEIEGGQGAEGSAANKEGASVDVLISAGSDSGQIALKVKPDGTITIDGGQNLKLSAKKILLDAGENIDINAGNKIEFSATTLTYSAKCINGKIPPNIGENICDGTYVKGMNYKDVAKAYATGGASLLA